MEKVNGKKQKFEYAGKLEHYQIMAQSSQHMEYETDKYSDYQNYLYKRAIYGLDALTDEELATMCSKKRQRIINVYKRAQVVINLVKQEVTNHYSNLVFKTFFPNSPITDILLSDCFTDEKFKNTLTFKDLKISKDQLVNIFIEEGILPKNFMSLERNPDQLPRLKKS